MWIPLNDLSAEDKGDKLAFRFNTYAIDKSWLISNLSVANNFKVERYIDTEKVIWIAASARKYDGGFSGYIFAYDKNKKTFIMNPTRSALSDFFMNEFTEKLIFGLQELTDSDEFYNNRKPENDREKFYSKLGSN